jgi:hypothetical protein
LFAAADSVAITYDGKSGFTIQYNAKRVKYLAKLYYDAIAKAPVDYQTYMYIKYKQWEKNNKGKGDKAALLPGFKIHLIKTLISKENGGYFTHIISIPYYLKIKVLQIKQGKYVSPPRYYPAGLTIPKTVLTAKVEDILKGEERFKGLNTINITILANWLPGAEKFFKVGEEYFVPLKPFNCFNGNCEGFALYVLPGANHGVFLIRNNALNVRDNYFHLGNTVDWDNFKKQFTKKFMIK